MSFKLEDIASFQKGFAFKSKDFEDEGIRIIKVTNLTDESVSLESCVSVSVEVAKACGKYDLYEKDIIITTVGSWPTNPSSVVGKVVRMPKTDKLCLLNQNAVRIRSNSSVNQEYLYYLLRNDVFKEYIIGTAQGSANQASITQKDIKKFIVKLPVLKEQESIAHILSTLDEKIEVNNQINKILENMAQTIFKQWFVDFEFPNEDGEPYKSSGGEMVESELGMIPKGWKVVDFRELFKFVKGKKPKLIEGCKFENSEKYLTIDVLNRNSVLFCSTEKVVETNDTNVLMVMDGASSGSIYFGQKGVVASTLAKLELISNNVSNQFLFYMIKFFENDIKAHTTGSAIPHTDKEYVYRLKIALPNDKAIQMRANKILCRISDIFIAKEQENSVLIETRDSLLPKLMSGEIRVPLDSEGELS